MAWPLPTLPGHQRVHTTVSLTEHMKSRAAGTGSGVCIALIVETVKMAPGIRRKELIALLGIRGESASRRAKS